MKAHSIKMPQTIYVFRDGDPADEIYLVEDSLDGFDEMKNMVGVYELKQTGNIEIGADAVRSASDRDQGAREAIEAAAIA